MTGSPVTLASVVFGWGSAYRIGYARDRWAAWRRDTHGLIIADTLTGLDTAIQADYTACPVPRAFDPPGVTAEDGDFILAGLFPVPNPAISDPIAIICARCGQAFVCDAASPAARDQTCGPCFITPSARERPR